MQTKIIADTLAKLKARTIDYTEVDPALWANKEFVAAAAKQNSNALAYAVANLTKDKEFMLEALKKAPAGTAWLVFECADDSLKNDQDFRREAQNIIDSREAV
ncbi:MAG: DUF4116 domain-containing protein [Candidatus Margulisbacteria bacterium]|jgi:hypothetical protein|nr:DUF4116 domain-containing protein [Candidatus Margulisiibacteriota bacterium]